MKKALKITINVLVFLGLAWLLFGPAKQIGYAPEQPFAYNHKIHAGDYKIDCQYCHSTVTYSKKAGIPGTNVCMNCHSSGVLGFRPFANKSDGKRVQKLIGELSNNYWSKSKSPEWTRIHNMPDHVRFSHAPHVKALLKPGAETKTACIPCHGDVATMDVVAQQESLNMGFCVNCHRTPTDKGFVAEYAKNGVGTNCGMCHY